MKQVKFNKCCLNVCGYLKYDKWYDVYKESGNTIHVKDDSGDISPYAKVWVSEEREI